MDNAGGHRNNYVWNAIIDRDINASKNILGLLLTQYKGEERPICFKP